MIAPSGIYDVRNTILSSFVYTSVCIGLSVAESSAVDVIEGLKKYGVFYSLGDIKDYLKRDEWQNISEAKKLLYDYNRYCDDKPFRIKEGDLGAYFRGFFSVESFEHGMNDSGKYQVGSKLALLSHGKLFLGPARCIRHLRNTFRDIGGPLQNSYYALSNYGIIREMADLYFFRYVIVSRFWHSTAAYGIAQAINDGMIIPPDSEAYLWPSDLLMPNLTFFYAVTADPEFLNTTAEPLTFEDRLRDVYRLMRDPETIAVSAKDEMTVATIIHQTMQERIPTQYPMYKLSDDEVRERRRPFRGKRSSRYKRHKRKKG